MPPINFLSSLTEAILEQTLIIMSIHSAIDFFLGLINKLS